MKMKTKHGFEECASGLPKGEAVASEGRKYNVAVSDKAAPGGTP
jgi:hypothetical protein